MVVDATYRIDINARTYPYTGRELGIVFAKANFLAAITFGSGVGNVVTGNG